jgi:nicotinamide riboside transporter PnuC
VTAEGVDYVIGFFVAGFLSTVASGLVALVGGVAGLFGWFLVAAAAPTTGVAIAEIMRRITRKHRAKSLFTTIIVAVVLGAVPVALFELFIMDIFGLIFQAIYLVIAVPIIYYRISGIHLTK